MTQCMPIAPAPNSTTTDIIQAKHLKHASPSAPSTGTKGSIANKSQFVHTRSHTIHIACPDSFSLEQPFFIKDPRQRGVTRATYRWPCVDRFRGNPPAAMCTSGIAAQNLRNRCCPSSTDRRPASIPSHPIRRWSPWKTRTKSPLHWSSKYKTMRISETQWIMVVSASLQPKMSINVYVGVCEVRREEKPNNSTKRPPAFCNLLDLENATKKPECARA